MGDGTTGVLFDVDGTLVDTTYLHTVCWAEALHHAGHDIPMARIHRAVGMGGAELLDHLLGAAHDKDTDEGVQAARMALYQQYWGRLRRLPGAAELVRACADRSLDVVLASSASAEELEALRSALDVDDAVDAATGSADAEAGKPSPDILEVALDRCGLAPRRAALVGDAVWDGQAAAAIDLTFIGVTCGGTSEAELLSAGAVEVWQHPADLLDHLDRSAIARLLG